MRMNKGWAMDNTSIRQKINDYRAHKHRIVHVRSILDTGRRLNTSVGMHNNSRFDAPGKSRLNMPPVSHNTASTFMTSVAVHAGPSENFHKREFKKTDNILKDNVV